MKIDIDISNWQFCDALACKHGKNYKVGDYLDMELTVKGIGAAVQEDNGENNGVRFNFGSGKLIFSRKVNYIPAWALASSTHHRQVICQI